MSEEKEEIKQAEPVFELSEFLEAHPPNQIVRIKKLGKKEYRSDYGEYKDEFLAPQIQLHCSNESCNGSRFFRFVGSTKPVIAHDDYTFTYVTYRCYNCLKEEKTFSIAAKMDHEFSVSGQCYKFGELPNFGPPTPSKLMTSSPPREISFFSLLREKCSCSRFFAETEPIKPSGLFT